MSFEIGRTMGQGLEDYEAGLEIVRSGVRADLSRHLYSLLEQKERGAARLDLLGSFESGLRGRLSSLNEVMRRIEARREAAPAEFSWVKGLLYMSISVLLIFADVAILGQVIAQFLGYPWYDPDVDQTFAQLVFTVPEQAFRSFPDLFFLTLALLLIGFFVKIWKDWYAIRFDGDRQLRKIDRLKFLLYTILAVLAFVSVGIMAAARLTVNLGNTSDMLARTASAILGLALPMVSAGFFLEGYDCLAARGLLWRLSLTAWIYRLPLYWFTGRRRRLAGELATPTRTIQGLEDAGHVEQATHEAILAYSRGYQEGVRDLFAGGAGGSLYEKLLPIAMRRRVVAKLTPRSS